MAAKKTEVMDGFAVVRSLAQARQSGALPPPGAGRRPPPSAGGGTAPPPVPTLQPHIGKTIQPTQHTVRCFTCGYEFKISGTTPTLYCSKCRAKIDMGDYTVEGPWRESIQTGGTVHIRPSGRLIGAKILAGNVIFEGSMDEDSSIACTQWLELAGETAPNPRQIEMRNLRIAAGRSMKFKYKLQVCHLELLGELEGDVEASGLVSIRAGGHLKGTVRGAHLEVEEGGGLSARVFIWPPDPAGS